MINKKHERNKVKIIDKHVVKELNKWREEINATLKQGERLCTLHPRKGCQPCDSCDNFAKCDHYRWERDFIHKEEKYEAEIARNKARKEVKKEKSLIVYPCEPFDSCCPDRELCQGEENCPWYEE